MHGKERRMLLWIILVLVLCGCSKIPRPEDSELKGPSTKEISEIQGSYAIDVYSYTERAGAADYVIVGKVIKELGTEYRFSSMPYTNYSVQVEENLKGELTQEEEIVVAKDGGLTKDGKEYEMFPDDILPVAGETYVFYIYAQEDGSNLVAGPNSTLPISEMGDSVVTTRNIQEDSENEGTILEQVKVGIVNQVISERERGVSKDDVSAK